MTDVYYNGVLLQDCEMLGFAQDIEAEQSGTDLKYSRFKITFASLLVSLVDPVEGLPYLSPSGNELLTRQRFIAVPSVPGETIADRYAIVAQRLQEYRKDFWVAIKAATNKAQSQNEPDPYTPNNTPKTADPYRVILAAAGLDHARSTSIDSGQLQGFLSGSPTPILRKEVIDCNSGPKPSNVRLSRIDGGRVMRVEFTIEVCRLIKDSDKVDLTTPPVRDAEKVKGVISNKWSITETLDNDWRSNITIDGTLVVSDIRYKVNTLRLMTATALFPYAKMIGRKFAVSEDGLTLGYSYQLQETGAAPPPGVVSWQGVYAETSQAGSGGSIGNIDASVKGTVKPPNGYTEVEYKQYLINVLFRIVRSRMNITGLAKFNANPGQNPQDLMVLRTVIVEQMHEPEVSISVAVQHLDSPKAGIGPQFVMRLGEMGKPLVFNKYDARWWPVAPAFVWDAEAMTVSKGKFGSAWGGYLQDPTSEWHGKPRGLAVDDPVTDRTTETEDFVAYLGQWTGTGRPDNSIEAYAPPNRLIDTGFNEEQFRGLSYLHCEIENEHGSSSGVMALPLSKPRVAAFGVETIATIPIHAGIQTRKFKMVATRSGAWPQVPFPVPKIDRGGIVETFIGGRVIPDDPKLGADGVIMEYSCRVEWTYAMSRPIGHPAAGSVAALDYYSAGSSPIDKTDPITNAIPISSFYDTSGAIEIIRPA